MVLGFSWLGFNQGSRFKGLIYISIKGVGSEVEPHLTNSKERMRSCSMTMRFMEVNHFFLSNFSVYLFSKKNLFDFYRKMRKFRQDKNQKGKIG